MEYREISSTLNTSYEYKNTGIIVTGSYSKDAQNESLLSINGSCYRNNDGSQGDYIGNFNGYPQSDGEILYDLSQMKRQDSNLVWSAIDDIEAEILHSEE